MSTIRLVAASLLALSALFAATPALAQQDVRYETVTKSEFAGAVGTVMRMAARMSGASLETTETTSIKGNRMRSDSDKTSSIVDMDAGRIISIDHNDRTYVEMTFAEMARMMDEMTAEARTAAQQQGTPQRDPAAGGETSVSFRFNVDRTRERERVAGYDATRAFITIEAEGEYRPEGAAANQPAGSLILFTDMWSSTSVPALSARESFDSEAAQNMARSGGAFAETMSTMFASDPRLRVGMERAAEEAAKIEGMALRTITRMVFVPAGQAFDRSAALAPAAPSSNRPSMGSVVGGMLRGRAGAGQAPPSNADAPPSQGTFLTVTTEIKNVTVAPLDASLFEPPAGYRRVEFGGR